MTHKNWFLVSTDTADRGALAGYPVKIDNVAGVVGTAAAWAVFCTDDELEALFEQARNEWEPCVSAIGTDHDGVEFD